MASRVRPWNAASNAITARPSRCEASDLDPILDRLGPGVEERRSDEAGERRQLAQALGELDVALVRHDREVGVDEPGGLLLDRLDDPRMAVADVDDSDAAREVDERVAVDVGDRRVQGLGREDRQVDLKWLRNGRGATGPAARATAARGSRFEARSLASWPPRKRTGAPRGYSPAPWTSQTSRRIPMRSSIGGSPMPSRPAYRIRSRWPSQRRPTAGAPSVRMVLLKAHDPRGFVFFTNRTSRKGIELRGQSGCRRRAALEAARASSTPRRCGPPSCPRRVCGVFRDAGP